MKVFMLRAYKSEATAVYSDTFAVKDETEFKQVLAFFGHEVPFEEFHVEIETMDDEVKVWFDALEEA